MHSRLARQQLRNHFRRAETRLLDDFDDLARRACDGDRRALGTIAIAFGGVLTDEARTELASPGAAAGECVCALFDGIAEGRLRFDPARERALDWMKGVVRELARRRDDEAEIAWGSW
ncbi:MAG TPA: hypothetical protein VGI39_33175 [Polyangiaceae bacterium]|jgi:hypothetical protein